MIERGKLPLPGWRDYLAGRVRRTCRALARSVRNRTDFAITALAGKKISDPLPRACRGGRWLVVETRHLGDVLFATPSLKSLKMAVPDSHLAVLIRPGLESVLDKNPHVDEILLYQDSRYSEMVSDLAGRSFDRACLLDRDERMAQLVFQAGIPERIGYDRPAAARFLTTSVPRTEKGRSEIHWSLRLAIAAGGSPVEEQTELFGHSSHAETCMKFGVEPNEFVVVHPGSDSSAPYKRWPVRRFAEVTRNLMDRGQAVVVTGLSSEMDMAGEFQPGPLCQPLLGRTSLDEFIDLIRASRLLITNDTGPAHIAAAFHKPCIVVAGFADPKIYHPYPPPHRALHHPIACGPCFGSPFDPQDCPYQSCLKLVTVDEVISNAVELLRERVAAII